MTKKILAAAVLVLTAGLAHAVPKGLNVGAMPAPQPAPLPAVLEVPAPTHYYALNGSYADAFGGPALVAHGGAFAGGSYSFADNAGLSLSNVLGAQYTIDFTFSLDSVAGWQKLVDYNDRKSDAGLYLAQGSARFYPESAAGAATATAGAWARMTITRDASGLVTTYLNGQQQTQFSDIDNNGAFGDGIAHFFMDDVVNGGPEAARGRVDYIAIFDHALSAGDVVQIPAVPEPETHALMLAGLGVVGFLARRRRVHP